MSRSVLIVDDLSVNRKILTATLRNDYDILEAENGEEALAVMRAHYKSLSAILLDIMMPVMDGYEVLRQMRSDASLAAIPVIMITGNEDEEARVKCLDLGANDFVMKPYNPDIIRHCLRNNIVLRETEAAVHALQRDRLTGLYNRDAFFEKVQEAVQQREAGYYIMACFDIDKFKVINDQFGTRKGDEVLKYIADVFRAGFETHGGICCRVAADDFAVLYPASFIDSEELSNLRRKSSAVEGLVSPITFSIGRYLVDDLSLSPSAMFDRAMLAAESVKGRYDAQIAQYDESMRKRLLSEQEVVTEMDAALAGNQFEAWYQPQYNHATGALVGSEALARWRHPQKGLISPGLFIPIFEKNGFVYELDKFIWEDACRHLRKWTDEGRHPLPVSVNISRYDIFRPDLVDVIAGLVKKYELPVELLRLEVKESAFSQSATQIISVVQRLIDAGFTVEIDDFGSGYSSLNTLKDVPAQVLKLDMKFLESSTNSQRGGIIVESIVRMAAWLGMSVIAEGVETVQQADFLRSIGCDYIQGYLYARPMPAADYEAHCKKSGKEEKLLALETVENLDNNTFWDPASMDTLIFNSYVGGACIFEFHNGEMHILRMNSKYIETFGEGVSDEIAFRQNPLDFMDEQNKAILLANIRHAIDTGAESTCEVCLIGLCAIEKPVYIRSAVRVIARASERYLLYCSVINITARREMMERLRVSEEENRLAIQHSETVVCRYDVETKTLKVAPHANAIFEMTSSLEDVPDASIRMGKISPETAEGYRAFYESIRRGEKSAAVVFQRSSTAGWRWVDAHASTIFSDDGKPVSAVISFIDVTERLEKEAVYKKWQQSLEDKNPQTYTLFRCNLSKNASLDTVEGSLLKIRFDESRLLFNERTEDYVAQYVFEEDRSRYLALVNTDTLLANYYRGNRSATLDYREKLPGGDVRYLRLSVELLEYPNSSNVEAYLMYTDVSDVKQKELLAKKIAENDMLTGALNRTAFEARTERILSDAKSDAQHALLLFDIDNFKAVNDAFGRATGDQTLVDIANEIRTKLFREDLVGRFGGDEFIVFLSDIPNDVVAANKAKQLCMLASKAFSLEVQISASVGIVMIPRDGTELETLYKKLDAALHYVKGFGKDNYAFYRDNMDDWRLATEEDAPRADAMKAERKRRMLIVDDNKMDYDLLASIFSDTFIVEKAKDGSTALTILRYYGAAISVVLLDLMMPGMDGFEVLDRMQSSAELRSIPVIVVSGDDKHDTCLRAIMGGATDFVTKPVDSDLLLLRVQAAISKADNARARAKSSYHMLQSDETRRYETVLAHTGVAVMELDWVNGKFTYAPFVSTILFGTYDDRQLWRILLSDMVTDAQTVQRMQLFLHNLAEDRSRAEGELTIQLKTPAGVKHWFSMTVYKLSSAYNLTDRLIMTFRDLGAEEPA